MSLVCGSEGKQAVDGGPMSPDQIVYCKSFPLWFEPDADKSAKHIVERLRQAIADHTAKTRFAPTIVLVKGVGLFSVGDDFNGANSARMVYVDAIKIMRGARRLGGVRYLTPDFRSFIEDWEVESYRKTVSLALRSAGRVGGKVAIVTGAAQGFGLEISQAFAAEGGTVVLADMNVEGAGKAAAELCAKHGAGRAIGASVNVTDAASIEALIDSVVRTYGGFDVFISNAGVLKAGSVKTQSERDFDFVTSVNYKGFFLCTQKACTVMATQRMACPEYWSDIIQINSRAACAVRTRTSLTRVGSSVGLGSWNHSRWNWWRMASRSTRFARATFMMARCGAIRRTGCSCSTCTMARFRARRRWKMSASIMKPRRRSAVAARPRTS